MQMLAPINVNEYTGISGQVYTPNSIRVIDVAVEDIAGALAAGFLPVGRSTMQDGIVAKSGGGAGGPLLLAQVCHIVTCAVNGDSTALRLAKKGDHCVALNLGAHPTHIFPSGDDTINGITDPWPGSNGGGSSFYCFVDGNWIAASGD